MILNRPRLFIGAALALALTPSAAQQPSADVVTLPYSWLQYCWATRDPACIRPAITPFELGLINREVTEAIITRENPDYYDPWTPFPADRRGDCDDDAATKRAALLALGVDPRAMHFETGEVTEPDGRKVNHIVLVVRLTRFEGGEPVSRDYVLDRRTPDRIYPPAQRPYAWRAKAAENPQTVVWSKR